MGTTKNLHLLMTADGKQQEQQLGKTQAMLEKLKGSLGGFAGVIGISLGALSAEGVVHNIERGLDQIVEMKHAADALGISIENINAIKFAAGPNWEGAEAGIGKMLKNLGDAQLGSKEAARGFHLLGVEAEGLAGLKTEDSLKQIIDRLHGIEDPAQRAYVASQIFGKGWLAMIPLIEKGSKGIDEAKKAAGELTEQMARDAARTKRDLKELGEAWDDFWRKRAAGFAAGRDKPEINPATGRWMTHEEWKAIREAREPLTAQELKTPQQIAEEDAAQKLVIDINALEEKLREEQAALEDAGSEVEKWAAKHAAAKPEMLATARAIEEQNKALKEQKEFERSDKQMWEHIFGDAKRFIEQTESPLDKFNEKLLEAEELLEADAISAYQYAAGLAKIVDEFDKVNAAADRGPGALVAGSGEAVSAEVKFQRAGEDASQDAQQRVEGLLKSLNEQSKRGADNAGKIHEALKNAKQVRF